MKSLLKKLLRLALTVIESAYFDDRGNLVVSVRPRKSRTRRCPHCGRKCAAYDSRGAKRRWRALDLGATMVFLEYEVVRVRCADHGVHAESVPWAHHASRFTFDFEQQVAWLCVHANRTVVAEIMRIDWKSVGGICDRVYRRLDDASGDRFDGLVRIGIDETSYKKGHKYMTVVLDHDTGRVVWCSKGHGKDVLRAFFSLLAPDQLAAIEVVTADGARWIADVVAECCPNAEIALDPFHVVSWMTGVLDEVRKQAWRDARVQEKALKKAAPKRGRGRPKKGEKLAGKDAARAAKAVKGSRFALLKNPESLTEGQKLSLERIAREDGRLYRAYMMKERLRDVFKAQSRDDARDLLDAWLASACRSWAPEIRELSKKIRRHKERILRSVELGVSNARVEAVNNKIKLTVRMGYGFRNIDNLIALVMLRCSKLPLTLPGRSF